MDDAIPIIRAKNGDTSYFKRTPVEDWANIEAECEFSVLHVSIKENHLHCTKVIYERCPDLLYQHRAKNDLSPLHVAAFRETKPSLIQFLISVADRKLYRMTDGSGSTPLQLAIIKSHIEAVKLLIEADPDQLSCGTPLLYALRLSLGETVDDISVKIRRLVLEKQPNACKIRSGELGWTALHYVASEGDLGAIEDIIWYCPDSEYMVDKEGHDFLDIASASGHPETVKNLLQRHVLHLANTMSKREKELCILPEYLVLYRELVNRFGEIVEPSKKGLEEDTPMHAALGRFLDDVSEIVHVKTRNVTQEKILEWEKKAEEYSAEGLHVSWFQDIVARYSDWFAKRVEYEDDIVTKEAKIETKREALITKHHELYWLENELKELNTEVAELKEQRDTYTPESDDPLLVIQRIEGIRSGNSAIGKRYTDLRYKYTTHIDNLLMREHSGAYSCCL